jgi:Domain of unknown function (DUF4865)/Putative mono-oxygenase ydhR
VIASMVHFTLPADTDWDAMRALARQRADEYYRSVPGLRSKAFIVKPEAGIYGGLYVWDSQAHLDAFLATDVFGGIVARLGTPTIEVFEVPAYIEAGALVSA